MFMIQPSQNTDYAPVAVKSFETFYARQSYRKSQRTNRKLHDYLDVMNIK